VDAATWGSLLTASPPSPRYAYSGTRIEIDMSRQVLLYIQNGVVTKTLPCSTGKPGWETKAGSYQINYKDGIGWVTGPLGPMYSACNVYPHHYIHGSGSVPAYAASHGCIRVTVWDMDELYPQLFRGMRVNISS
jgi:lipoprotein-anchoring transpeptidase ErfK/SrfK